jgi:N-acetylneuraminic acid mutarotase
MHRARNADTATLLPSGKVLVAGGFGTRLKPLASAEIYDPARNSWTLTSSLPATRFSHAASLLPDGRVLLVGGIVNGHISRSTVIYNPATNLWTAGRPTQLLHAGVSAATLPDRHVLIIGAFGGGSETFHPESNGWTVSGATPLRQTPIMVRLLNGSVLLASGEGTHHRDLLSAALFDPATGLWHSTGSMRSRRNLAAAALLLDGRVLVAGGEQPSVHVLKSVELYDPSSESWTQGPSMAVRRDGAAATTLPDGKVMVCGGADFDGVLSSCEMYTP